MTVSAELAAAVTSTGTPTFVATRRDVSGRHVATSEQAPGWCETAHSPEFLLHLVTAAPAEVLGWPPGYAVLLVHDPTPPGGTP